MKKIVQFLALGALLAASPLSATDLPQGADTLKLLANEADLIVKVANPVADTPATVEAADAPRRYRTYTVTIGEVVLGSAQVGQTVRVAVPERLAVGETSAFDNSVLFLRSARADQAGTGGAAYTLISGRYGLVADASADLLSSVKAYTRQADLPAGAVSWAARHASSSNAFLQRSAIMELYTERDRNAAFEVLRRVVTSGAVHPDNRSIAIEALEETGRAAAKAPLRSIAENGAEAADLRAAAVRAFANLPDAGDQLQRWLGSGDPVLKQAATQASSDAAHGTHTPH